MGRRRGWSKDPRLRVLVTLTFLALIGVVVPGGRSAGQQADQSVSAVDYGSRYGFDLEGWRCRFADGVNDEYMTGDDQTFSTVYRKCRASIFFDIEFLAGYGIRTARIFPMVSQFLNADGASGSFLNEYIANLDEVIAAFGAHGIKLHVVLNSLRDCKQSKGYFDYQLLNNRGSQDAYLAGVAAFLSRYRDNTTIVSYDLFNEASALMTDYVRSTIRPSGDCLTSTNDDIADFLRRLYGMAKAVDRRHAFTFSFSGADRIHLAIYRAYFQDITDIFDLHFYVPAGQLSNRAEYTEALAEIRKPVIYGEAGITAPTGTLLNSSGTSCEPLPFAGGYGIPPPAICHQLYLTYTALTAQAAEEAAVRAVFFHNFHNPYRFVGARTYAKDPVSGVYRPVTQRLMPAGYFVVHLVEEEREERARQEAERRVASTTETPALTPMATATQAPTPSHEAEIVPETAANAEPRDQRHSTGKESQLGVSRPHAAAVLRR